MPPFQHRPVPGVLPYVIAHRGISGKAPENTIAAFSLACAAQGIDMIELDVRLSKDNDVIVLHDRTLQRTSTGNGVARNYSLEEIKEFDAGSWFDPSFSNERIPTLREVLQLVNKQRWVDIELKSDFLHREQDGLLERKVLDVVHDLGLAQHVFFSSFDHRMMSTLKRFDHGATTGVLYNVYRDYGRLPSKLAGRVGASIFVCAKRELTKRMVSDARQHGIGVYVYTLNTSANVNKMMELGVDGIISDNADDVVGFLKQGRT